MPHSTTVPSASRADLLNEEILQAEHRQLLGSFLTTVSDGVSIADARGTFIYSSPYARQLFGAGGTASAPIQGNAFGLFQADEQTPFESDQLPIRRALKGEEVRDVEMFIRNENVPQGRHVRCDGIPLRDEQGRVIGGVSLVKNLDPARRSEGEELERRIAERTAQLQLANRELEDFAYSVAHDLRAPLRSITGFSDALVEEFGERLEEVGRGHLKRVVTAAKHMSELIDGILALSRVNSTELVARSCELSTMARTILEQLQAEQPERKVRVSIQEGLVDRGDPRLLRAVLENLLGNAWKFTRGREEAEIEFRATQDARGVRTYVVSDNGAGFDMAYREKLFGVFKRLHSQKEFEGTGVGLATVQRIIRRHGGRVWGEGERGQGARFFFTLGESPLSSQKV